MSESMRSPMRRFTLLTAVLLVGACAGSDTKVTSSPGPPEEISPPDVTAASVEAFSNELIGSPAWETVRRGTPPDLESVLAGHKGAIRGRLTGISLMDPELVPASEVVGEDVEILPGTEDGKVLDGPAVSPTLSIQSIVLEVAVESSSGQIEGDLKTVGIPIVVWANADAGETQQKILDDLLRRLEPLAPI